jgi:hypothetical protein
MTIIDLPLFDRYESNRDWVVVSAKIVDVAPHLANVATFAAHKWHGAWRITNVETGCFVATQGIKSLRHAFDFCAHFLADARADEVVAEMQKFRPLK